MLRLKDTLAKGLKQVGPTKEASKEVADEKEPAINELVERVFTTRNLVHFAHWNTNSYASHMALGDLYESIVDEVDDIVETYQGEFGLLKNLECDNCKSSSEIVDVIQEDSSWLKANKANIANGSSTISNMLDNLNGIYNKTLYKLKNLK